MYITISISLYILYLSLYTFLSIFISIYLSIYPSIYLSIYLSSQQERQCALPVFFRSYLWKHDILLHYETVTLFAS